MNKLLNWLQMESLIYLAIQKKQKKGALNYYTIPELLYGSV